MQSPLNLNTYKIYNSILNTYWNNNGRSPIVTVGKILIWDFEFHKISHFYLVLFYNNLHRTYSKNEIISICSSFITIKFFHRQNCFLHFFGYIFKQPSGSYNKKYSKFPQLITNLYVRTIQRIRSYFIKKKLKIHGPA